MKTNIIKFDLIYIIIIIIINILYLLKIFSKSLLFFVIIYRKRFENVFILKTKSIDANHERYKNL